MTRGAGPGAIVKNLSGVLNLGMVYSDLGRLDEAVVSLRNSLRLRRDHVPTMVALADVQARAGETDDAAFILLRASVQDPADALVRQNLGGALLEKGDLDAATPHLRECLKLDLDNVQEKLGLAQALES